MMSMIMMLIMGWLLMMIMNNYMKLFILIMNLIFILMMIMFMKFNLMIEWMNISYNFSMNYFNFFLILMSMWILGMVIGFIDKLKCNFFNYLLLIVLIFCFSSLSMLMFYYFFEISLIIVFYLILNWGSGVMRLIAGYYFVFYTLFFSFPLLIFLLIISYNSNLVFMNLLELLNLFLNSFLYLYLLMAFLMKIPMFMFHNWLLKAHVEAPVFGSMILAAILLKLGTYGLLRFMLIFYFNTYVFNLYLLIFSLMGSLFISIICLRQIDMKILVAYSSVVHMGILLSSMMTLLKLGFIGSYLMMISHGLCSSGLFFLVNLCYNESGSRLMLMNKGMMNYFPSLTLLWFLLCSSNMSAPISLNLISELMLMMSLVMWLKWLIIILIFFCFFSFSYSLYLFSYVQHGNFNFFIKIKEMKLINYLILLLHWIPLNFIFLNMNMF